jgi:Fe2+ transport system protein B
MENRMTALENRFDTILPTLATKADVKALELKLAESSAQLELKLAESSAQLELKLAESSAQHQTSLNRLEIKLLDIIHREIKTVKQELQQEIKAVCQKIDSNNWRMIVWMTTVVMTGFAGVFYIARYVPAG